MNNDLIRALFKLRMHPKDADEVSLSKYMRLPMGTIHELLDELNAALYQIIK